MPRISSFYGITIWMYWNEGIHARPHFHARYAGQAASISMGVAAASIQGWWEHLGCERDPQATTLTITADCGGSKRQPPAPLEARAAAARRHHRAHDPGLPLPARHLEVEQAGMGGRPPGSR